MFLELTLTIQAAEQLNSWLVGFAPIVGRMRVERFDFFMHAMLWLHGIRKEASLDCFELD